MLTLLSPQNPPLPQTMPAFSPKPLLVPLMGQL